MNFCLYEYTNFVLVKDYQPVVEYTICIYYGYIL